MEEGFRERVQRLFGSHLFQTVPKSSFPATSWSVSDSEVERREWNRQPGGGDPARDERPCAAAFDDKQGCLGRIRRDNRRFEGYLADLDEFDEKEKGEDEGEDDVGDADGEDEEQRQIRGSIGLDSTLDHEDEEDEYDRAAVCKDWSDGRLYMRDVTDHGPYVNYHRVMTDLLDDETEESGFFSKDPRADHTAASFRLQEDNQESGTFNPDPNDNYERPAEDYSSMVGTGGTAPKSILKRKTSGDDSKPKKRVHFDPAFVNHQTEMSGEVSDAPISDSAPAAATYVAEATDDDPKPFEEGDSPGVPDYVRNPSKYTKYTFDTTNEDDDSLNRTAFADFCKLIGRSSPTDTDSECSTEPPKSVVFTPRRKAVDVMWTDASNKVGQEVCDAKDVRSISISAGEDQEDGYTAMDCDEQQQQQQQAAVAAGDGKPDLRQREARKYRVKASVDDNDTS